MVLPIDICIRWLFRQCVSLTPLTELYGSEEQRELDDEFDKINQQEMEEAYSHWDKQVFSVESFSLIPQIRRAPVLGVV